MSMHTPSPWKISRRYPNTIVQGQCPRYVPIAKIVKHDVLGPTHNLVEEIAAANAVLIAAAPELLDALRELVERDRTEAAESGFTDDEMTWLEDARRVIAKATAS